VNFWATWCVPCVAEFPMLNDLVKAAGSQKVQLILADYNGEDRAKVVTFLKRHPVSGWVGIDPARETQKRFGITGVTGIPVTFIVGPDGKVAHVTGNLETLKAEQLIALADGKKVTFDDSVKADAAQLDTQKKAEAEAIKVKITSLVATDGKILAKIDGVTLAEAASAPDDGIPADVCRHAFLPPDDIHLIDCRIADLVADLYAGRPTRVVYSAANSGKRYNLHIVMPGVSKDKAKQTVEQALAKGLGIRAEARTLPTEVLILAATAGTAGHFDAAESQAKHYCFFNPTPPEKALICVAGSLGKMAEAAEQAVNMPVLDESGLTGNVTATMAVTGQDRESIAALLSKHLGLTLTASRRPIEMLMVLPL